VNKVLTRQIYNKLYFKYRKNSTTQHKLLLWSHLRSIVLYYMGPLRAPARVLDILSICTIKAQVSPKWGEEATPNFVRA